MSIKTALVFLLLLPYMVVAQDTSTIPTTTVNTTGYSTLCQSCVAFLEHLPGYLENYSQTDGINANTLCTSLYEHMPTVGGPCFKLFAEYWPNGTSATTLEICGTLYFC